MNESNEKGERSHEGSRGKRANGIWKKALAVWCLLLLTGVLTTSLQTQAASKKSKAMKAYESFLEEHPSQYNDIQNNYQDASFSLNDKSYIDEYFLYDVDKNGVPEMFTYTYVNFRWHIVRVYTWNNQKVKLYKFSDGRETVFDNCYTANGNYQFSICKKGHVHNDFTSNIETNKSVYKGKKGKLLSFLEYRKQRNFTTDAMSQDATKNGQEITVENFEKYTKGCKTKQLKIYSNNPANLKLLKNGKAKVNK